MSDLITGVGRMVQGDPSNPITKHTFPGPKQGHPLTHEDGSPMTKFFFAVAFLKSDAVWNTVHAEIKRLAAGFWLRGESLVPGFSFKITDGDDPKNKDKIGFAGCDVVSFKRSFKDATPVPLYKVVDGAITRITDTSEVKCGYHVKVSFQVNTNKTPTKPGIHINPSSVLLWAEDEVIANFDPSTAWGGQLPPTATQVPATPPPPNNPAQAWTTAVPAATQVPVQTTTQVPVQAPFSQGPPTLMVTPKAQAMNLNSWADVQKLGMDEAQARGAGLVT